MKTWSKRGLILFGLMGPSLAPLAGCSSMNSSESYCTPQRFFSSEIFKDISETAGPHFAYNGKRLMDYEENVRVNASSLAPTNFGPQDFTGKIYRALSRSNFVKISNDEWQEMNQGNCLLDYGISRPSKVYAMRVFNSGAVSIDYVSGSGWSMESAFQTYKISSDDLEGIRVASSEQQEKQTYANSTSWLASSMPRKSILFEDFLKKASPVGENAQLVLSALGEPDYQSEDSLVYALGKSESGGAEVYGFFHLSFYVPNQIRNFFYSRTLNDWCE